MESLEKSAFQEKNAGNWSFIAKVDKGDIYRIRNYQSLNSDYRFLIRDDIFTRL